MIRLRAIVAAIGIVMIATALGVAFYLWLGFDRYEAAIVALAILSGLTLTQTTAARLRDRADMSEQIADLSRSTADIAKQVAEISRKSKGVETEVEAFGIRLKRLSQSIIQVPENSHIPITADIDQTASGAATSSTERRKNWDHNKAIAIIRSAIDAGQAELYLQPIVTLPQRKVRYYEAALGIPTQENELLSPHDVLDGMPGHELWPLIDNLLVFRCVEAARRLLCETGDVGLFCPLTRATLAHPDSFSRLTDFMHANRGLASCIVFEFDQMAIRTLGRPEQNNLATLAQLGFRFAMNRITELPPKPQDLADQGFRFVKASAALLLSRTGTSTLSVPFEDFSNLLGRSGIDLIADTVESEAIAMNLLDFDVRFGQGVLFAPPQKARL